MIKSVFKKTKKGWVNGSSARKLSLFPIFKLVRYN